MYHTAGVVVENLEVVGLIFLNIAILLYKNDLGKMNRLLVIYC
jgi:hypothetical protein